MRGMYTYKLPQRILTNKAGYEFLARMDADLQQYRDSEITIDFNDCDVLDANLSSALGAILDNLTTQGNDVTLSLKDNHPVTASLSRNDFLAVWNKGTTEEEKENFIVYKRFHRSDSDKFKRYIDEWLIRKQKFPKHTDLAGERIQESIYEIYVNATTHGDTEYVYCCGEYKPDSSTLDMTVVDRGRTIPANVNDFLTRRGRETLESEAAIEWAFVSGNTTKTEAGGLGLAILKEFVTLNRGCLQMVSGSAVLEFDAGRMESYLLDTPFPGTIVNVNFNFNDNKNYYMKSERVNPDDLL